MRRDVLLGLVAVAAVVTVLLIIAGDRFREGGAPGQQQAAAAAVSPPGPEPMPEPGEISVLTLLGEMADLDHLAKVPVAHFSTGQASSMDRRSRSPQEGASWFANDDFVTDTQANLVRVETAPDGSKRYVLLDVAGPGAVVRIWTATPTGTLRIYVDEDPHPALEAPMASLLSGAVSPFLTPFAHVTASGYNLYFPFAYKSRCIVTIDSIVFPDPFTGRPMSRFYYQVGYRTYQSAESRRVRPYSAAELARARGAIGRVASVLRDGLPPTAPKVGRRTITIPTTTAEPGSPSIFTVTAPTDGGRIAEFRIVASEQSVDKLSSTFLSIAFDGEETVHVPLVHLFGTGPPPKPYATLPMTVGEGGSLVCRFPMPFRNRAVVSISRKGPGAVTTSGEMTLDAVPFGADTLLFHAGWRPRATIATRPFSDWHIATINGSGHHVGTLLNVENPPGAAWWGEGDEKIYIDGESFPSVFGTGTEDYFGYAWSRSETFAHAFHAQTRAPAHGFAGLFSMNRFHVVDPIRFERSLRFDFEIWHWTDTSIAVDATLYWYARPGGSDDFPRGDWGE